MGASWGYPRVCGQLWYGKIYLCPTCRKDNTESRIAEKLEQILDKTLVLLSK
jgi:hypothetical protein